MQKDNSAGGVPPMPAKRGRGRPRTIKSDSATGGAVQALERGLLVLKTLGREGSVNLTNLALLVGMPTSTASRLLGTLEKHGFVDFNPSTQEWAVGIEAFYTGSTYLKRTNLVDASQSVMRDLMGDTGETSNLAIEDDGEIAFISQVETHNPIRAFHRPGSRGHMHASGIGKALLAGFTRARVEDVMKNKGMPVFTDNTLITSDKLFADLQAIQDRGWSYDDEERYIGMRCVAAAIHDASGHPVAGVSVSGPTVRFSDEAVLEISKKVTNAAALITRKIGGRPPDEP